MDNEIFIEGLDRLVKAIDRNTKAIVSSANLKELEVWQLYRIEDLKVETDWPLDRSCDD